MGSIMESLNKGLEDKYGLGENNNKGGKETMSENLDSNSQAIMNELKTVETKLDEIKAALTKQTNKIVDMTNVLVDAVVDNEKPKQTPNEMKK